MVEVIEAAFPGLRGTDWRESSQAEDCYNCIAWAADVTSQWWWPSDGSGKTFWPETVPNAVTLVTFRAAFATLGYAVCNDETLEVGFEKVAIFTNEQGIPTHAARQLDNGHWTSKLGRLEDIEHLLRAIEGIVYGSVALLMRRPVMTATNKPESG
jgi:hypothetical protein